MMFSHWQNSGGDIFPQLRLGGYGFSLLSDRLTTAPRPNMFRAAWAEAQVVVPSMLAQGYHPVYLEHLAARELMGNNRSSYRYEFFNAFLRILTNLRRANQFLGLPCWEEYEMLRMVETELLKFESMMYDRYSRLPGLGGGFMVDSQTEMELARSGPLDEDAKKELVNIQQRELRSQIQKVTELEYSRRKLQIKLADSQFRAETAEAQLDIMSRGGSRNGGSRFSGGSSTSMPRHSVSTPRRLEPKRETNHRSNNDSRVRKPNSNHSVHAVRAQNREMVQQAARSKVEADQRNMASTRSSQAPGQVGTSYASSSRDPVPDANVLNSASSTLTSSRGRGPNLRINEERRSRFPTTTGSMALAHRSRQDNGRVSTDRNGARSGQYQTQNDSKFDIDSLSSSMFSRLSVSEYPPSSARQFYFR